VPTTLLTMTFIKYLNKKENRKKSTQAKYIFLPTKKRRKKTQNITKKSCKKKSSSLKKLKENNYSHRSSKSNAGFSFKFQQYIKYAKNKKFLQKINKSIDNESEGRRRNGN